eukprot:3897683-Alexandrium_andersonii.AAC.1
MRIPAISFGACFGDRPAKGQPCLHGHVHEARATAHPAPLDDTVRSSEAWRSAVPMTPPDACEDDASAALPLPGPP